MVPAEGLSTPIPAPARARRVPFRVLLERRARRAARLWRLYLLKAELRFAPTESQRIFLLTLAIGVACGLGAVAFHLAIDFFESHLIERAAHAAGQSFIAWTLLTPVLGGLACGALLEYVFPAARGSGIPQVKQAFAATPPVVPLRDALGKFCVSSLQLGSGASLGREGPTVQICAGIASFLGRVVGVSPKTQRRLLPVGVAAGIAAAFNAPIAAVTFTIEEVVGTLDQAVLSGVIVAAALAAVIERGLLGENPVFDVPQSYALRHASSLVLYAGIGVLSGVLAAVFSESLLGLRARIRRIKALPRWAHPAIGGGATGALAVVGLVVLHSSGVTGGGYGALGQALNGEFVWWVLLGLCGLKLAATVISYSSGGAGGIFAPTLFIGGTLGGAVGAINSHWFGHVDEPVGAFALVGMGAMFAGVVRAPMTSVLIIIEMTRGYSLILPLMIANMSAYVIARRFRQQPIYEALLEQDGIHLRHATAVAPQHALSLLDGTGLVALSPAMSGQEVLLRCRDPEGKRVYPVVDAERRLLGIVTPDDLALLGASSELVPLTTASDLMREPVSVAASDELGVVLEKMLNSGLRELPVVDAGNRLLGCVDDRAITRAYGKLATPGA